MVFRLAVCCRDHGESIIGLVHVPFRLLLHARFRCGVEHSIALARHNRMAHLAGWLALALAILFAYYRHPVRMGSPETCGLALWPIVNTIVDVKIISVCKARLAAWRTYSIRV